MHARRDLVLTSDWGNDNLYYPWDHLHNWSVSLRFVVAEVEITWTSTIWCTRAIGQSYIYISVPSVKYCIWHFIVLSMPFHKHRPSVILVLVLIWVFHIPSLMSCVYLFIFICSNYTYVYLFHIWSELLSRTFKCIWSFHCLQCTFSVRGNENEYHHYSIIA